MRWDAIIKENRQHGVRYSGKSEAGKKTGVVCKERLHTIQYKAIKESEYSEKQEL